MDKFRDRYAFPFRFFSGFASLRGLSQYGLLHLGHTRGGLLMSAGGHLCPHRSHWNPSSLIIAISLTVLSQQHIVKNIML